MYTTTRRSVRTKATLALAALLASLLMTVSSETARAVESIPDLQWPAADVVVTHEGQVVASPSGEVTIGCSDYDGAEQDLVTFDANGDIVRQISRTEQVGGVDNCIKYPTVGHDGSLYGAPDGGTRLLAYNDNGLKWNYPGVCSSTDPVVGANGLVYVIRSSNDHLIGLTPEVGSGQTQPTKAVDVALVPNETDGYCGSRLHPFEDGIAISIESQLFFYSYSGKYLGELNGESGYGGQHSSYRNSPIGSNGRLFYPTWTSDDVETVHVSVHDPLKGRVVWSEQASTQGADASSARTYPLPNGGVLASVREQKMLSNGEPATPVQYVHKMVAFTEEGQESWSMILPTEDAQGNRYSGNPAYAVDTFGRIIVLREKRGVVGVTTIEIKAVDSYDGSAVYQDEMVNDEGVALLTDPAIGPGTIYVSAVMCASSSCSYDNAKLYPVELQGLGLDYPRGPVLSAGTPSQPAPLSAVALGDSFSSGEGVAPYEEGTDEPGYNMCHRSHSAYSQVLAHDPGHPLEIKPGDFGACSGAETDHVIGSWPDDEENANEPPQVDRLWDPDVVTLTIGGNDMKFGDFAIACVSLAPTQRHCNFDSSAYNTSRDLIENDLPDKLKYTYREILGYAYEADLYVLGYPHVAPEKTEEDPMDPRCPFLYYSGYDTMARPVLWGDAQAARDIVDRLNAAIEDAVNEVREDDPDNVRIHFVSATDPGSPFEGHEMCSTGDSYFLNVDQWPGNNMAPFHPNERGQAAYAELLADALTS